MGKVQERREENIKKAVEQGNWEQVTHLLNQEYENSNRKSREYGLLSLNYRYASNDGEGKELENYIPDDTTTTNPVEALIHQELMEALYSAIDALDELDRQILLIYFFENKNYTQISKEIGVSDNRVRRKLAKTLEKLAEKLQEYK